MSEHGLTLIDAIQMAMQAEKQAADLYHNAVSQTANPLGKRLFNQLAEFERHHYKKLEELAASLQKQGKFIAYESSPPFLAQSEVSVPEGATAIPEANKMSMMQIIKMAQDAEVKAKNKYNDLAAQTTNPVGRKMFEQLAQEEEAHYRLLRDVYWNLNERGTWVWPKG